MSIKVRKATANDIDFLTWAVLESSRSGKKLGIFDLIFECDDDVILKKKIEALLQTTHKSYVHFSNFLIAEVDGKEAATLCGYEPRHATSDIFSKALLEVEVDGSYESRIASYNDCLSESDIKTWMIDFVEVVEGINDLPVIKALIQKSLLGARLMGYRKAQTFVDIGATETEILYKKLGFHFLDEKRSSFFAEVYGRPGITRFQMEL